MTKKTCKYAGRPVLAGILALFVVLPLAACTDVSGKEDFLGEWHAGIPRQQSLSAPTLWSPQEWEVWNNSDVIEFQRKGGITVNGGTESQYSWTLKGDKLHIADGKKVHVCVLGVAGHIMTMSNCEWEYAQGGVFYSVDYVESTKTHIDRTADTPSDPPSPTIPPEQKFVGTWCYLPDIPDVVLGEVCYGFMDSGEMRISYWEEYFEGTWHLEGNQLIVDGSFYDYSGSEPYSATCTYEVAQTSMTLSCSGDTFTMTRQ
jgi:hypothetical protein